MYEKCYVLVIIVMIFMLIMFYTPIIQNNSKSNNDERERVVDWLKMVVDHVCRKCNMNPNYELRTDTNITYTEKSIFNYNTSGVIYLAIWDNIDNKLFQINTLVYSVLHEIAHVLSPSIKHEPPFDTIESLLLTTAHQLSYYNPNIPHDPHYITIEIN